MGLTSEKVKGWGGETTADKEAEKRPEKEQGPDHAGPYGPLKEYKFFPESNRFKCSKQMRLIIQFIF